jgi:tRNA-specific 2-thiouridylase
MKKVLLAMSGGTDSSVAAILLEQDKYQVEGITFRSYDNISKGCLERENGCCNVDTLFEAKQLATTLGFPHRIIDSRQDFKDTVIKDFISEYLKWRTPNPCVVCNTTIKWGSIADIARAE